MPIAARHTNGPKAINHRVEPYAKPAKSDDKENADPNANPIKSTKKSTKPRSNAAEKGDYRDIHLDEINGEIPCYDDATTVRRKLKKLLTDKSIIPGTNGKRWSQAAMSAEMEELERRGHPVEYNRNANGPSPRSLGNFLKKTGKMGAGDSPCYYWGYALLEKLRIYNGDKKSKAREKAEEEFPGGHVREDNSKRRVTMMNGSTPPAGAWGAEARGTENSRHPQLPQPAMPDAPALVSPVLPPAGPPLGATGPLSRPGLAVPALQTQPVRFLGSVNSSAKAMSRVPPSFGIIP